MFQADHHFPAGGNERTREVEDLSLFTWTYNNNLTFCIMKNTFRQICTHFIIILYYISPQSNLLISTSVVYRQMLPKIFDYLGDERFNVKVMKYACKHWRKLFKHINKTQINSFVDVAVCKQSWAFAVACNVVCISKKYDLSFWGSDSFQLFHFTTVDLK